LHIGPALTEARTEAGMTVEDVSERTRIRRTIITDIERDDYASCGGDFYARGHIRAIAKVVGADPVPLIQEFDADVAARDSIELQTGPDPKTWLQAEGRADPLLWQPAAAPEADEGAAQTAVGDIASPATGPDAPGGRDPAATRLLIGDQATQFLRGDWAAAGPRASGGQDTAPPPILPSGPALSSAGVAGPARVAGSAGALRAGAADALRGGAAATGQAAAAALQWAATRISQARTQLPARQPARSGPPGSAQPRSAQPRSAQPRSAQPRSAPPQLAGRIRDAAAEVRRAGAEALQRLSRLRTADPGASRVIGVAAIALAALVLILYGIFSGPAHAARPAAPMHHPAPARQHPAAGPSTSAASSPTGAPAAVTLRPARIRAFGPAGPAAGDHQQAAALALSPNGAGWHSNWYTTARFGGLQSGTGLLVDMGRTVTVSRVTVRLGPAPGATVQLRAGAAPVLAALRPAAGASGGGGTVVLAPRAPVQARYLLIWFTRLPPDNAGTYQATVNGISVTGSPAPD
jgi:transcriptional regulator with XRE-family HTH domain